MIRRIFGVVILLIVIYATTGCSTQVPPANVGVVFNGRTGISQNLMKPQVVTLGPWEKLYTFPTSIKNASYIVNAKIKDDQDNEKTVDESIHCSTNEGGILSVDITVVYHVAPENVVSAFQNFGSTNLDDVQNHYIRWSLMGSANEVSGNHSIFDLTSKDRAVFGPEIQKVLQPKLAEWGISVDSVMIGEVYPPQDVSDKIKARIDTRNHLDLSKVTLQKTQIDAQTVDTNARRDATLNAITAKQNSMVIKLKRLQLQKLAIARWNGKAPQIGKAQIPFTDITLQQ